MRTDNISFRSAATSSAGKCRIAALVTAACFFAAAPTTSAQVRYFWVPQYSSGASPVIPDEETVAGGVTVTLKSSLGPPITRADLRLPYYQVAQGDLLLHIRPSVCQAISQGEPGRFRITTSDGTTHVAPAPAGTLACGDRTNVAWTNIQQVAVTKLQASSVAEPHLTVTTQDGGSVELEYDNASPIRWGGAYDYGHDWAWFVPIVTTQACHAWLDICEVRAISVFRPQKTVLQSGRGGGSSLLYEFRLLKGSNVLAGLRTFERFPCKTGFGWATIARDRIASIQVHGEHLRPPIEHLQRLPGALGSRRGGPPYAKIVTREGHVVMLEAARFVNAITTIPQPVEGVPFLAEDAEQPTTLSVTNIAEFRWRGSLGDTVVLKDGRCLKGRLDLNASYACFGRSSAAVWTCVNGDEIRAMKFAATRNEVIGNASPEKESRVREIELPEWGDRPERALRGE